MSPSQWHSLDSGIYARLGARGWELGVGSGAFLVHKRRSKQHNWFMDIVAGAVGALPTSPWHWPPLCRPNPMTSSEKSLPSLWLRVFSGCLSLPGLWPEVQGVHALFPKAQPSTHDWWEGWINIPVYLSLRWTYSEVEGLHCVPGKPRDGAPTAVTSLTTHPPWVLTDSSFPVSPPIPYRGFPGTAFQKNYLHRNPCLRISSWGNSNQDRVIHSGLLSFGVNFLPLCLDLNSKINFYLTTK